MDVTIAMGFMQMRQSYSPPRTFILLTFVPICQSAQKGLAKRASLCTFWAQVIPCLSDWQAMALHWPGKPLAFPILRIAVAVF
jgi:hypothetical protein